MKLNLDILPFGRSGIEVEQSLATAESDATEAEDGLVGELTVDNTERHVVLGGELTATVAAVCDRCLEPFSQEYPVPVDITVIRDRLHAETEDDENLDTWVIHQAQGEVELDDPLREAALLARPQKSLCDENCRGLCPSCGVNLNRGGCDCAAEDHDPRWDGLPD